MRGEETKIEVDQASTGERLDVFLARHAGSRSSAARLIAQGLVTVNGRQATKRFAVCGGDIVVVSQPELPAVELTSEPSVTIVHDDEDLMVIDKPAGLVVHPGPGHSSGTLAQLLSGTAGGGEAGRAGIVHRLDRDTSGLLIVAKSEEAHRALSEMIRRREVQRHYRALVVGHPGTTEGTIDAPIGRDSKRRTVVSMNTDRPRDAVTHFRVAETLPDASLLDVRLATGRTHQIRVHLAAIGLPVAGDPTYGRAHAYGLSRQFLHASDLVFDHPLTGNRVTVHAGLPQDLSHALVVARGGQAGGELPPTGSIP